MTRLLGLPTLSGVTVFSILSACASSPFQSEVVQSPRVIIESAGPFRAQVVGLQWLNPLQRRDYPTEWQLLWTLGLTGPNKNDDMVRTMPHKYAKFQLINSIADGNNGRESFRGYHHKYFDALIGRFYDIYFSSSEYFYNAHSLTDKSTWRELAGIHVEYALPEGRLDIGEATSYAQKEIVATFAIGNVNFPTAWTRNTPPDVRVTMGGPNAGFTSLTAAMRYLQSHPNETVWAMNWDAPNFPPSDEGLNENMVLLVLAGPNYKTERAALAWIGLPATRKVDDFPPQKEIPSIVQAWTETIETAAANAGKSKDDIGYVIHDASKDTPAASDRIGPLAQTLTLQLPQLEFLKHTFNTPALLGEMGAGSALTNVALAIAYANHLGKNVLVAGTTDQVQPLAVVVTPPAVVRPIDPDKPWFRARGGNHAYLMWWGIRHDEKWRMQGYSD